MLSFAVLCVAGFAAMSNDLNPSWMPFSPGIVKGEIKEDKLTLENLAIRVAFDQESYFTTIVNRWQGDRSVEWQVPVILYRDDDFQFSKDLEDVEKPKLEIVKYSNGPKVGKERGKALSWVKRDPDTGLRIGWKATLLEDQHFVIQEFTLSTEHDPVYVKEIVFGASEDARALGTAQGSPMQLGPTFLGLMHPMAKVNQIEGHTYTSIERKVDIQPGAPVTYRFVTGVFPEGQLKRAFSEFVNQVRPRPYKPFLHYNSWYDLATGKPFDEAGAVDRIRTIREQLTTKRGVNVASYLFDDGWDDTQSDWRFHKGFPNGLAPLAAEVDPKTSGIGVWLSPWGGYSKARTERLAWGKAHGFEVDSQGYVLSGPKYFKRFREVCLDFVKRFGVNQFKFDGTGSPDKYFEGSAFASDFDAAIALIQELRQVKPDLFINLTTGTWPSPFWMMFADSVWRGGSDHSFSGVGSNRQRWITYRDSATYQGVVRRGPMFPLNSLMLHGIIYAKDAHDLNTDPQGDFPDEVWSYFGSGTQLQELYITPNLLKDADWDVLRDGAVWSQKHAAELQDVRWVGGDPGKLEVYGWAGWSPNGAVLTLRNPSAVKQAFAVNLPQIFELPSPYSDSYTATTIYGKVKEANLKFVVADPKTIRLEPFEVRVLELKYSGNFAAWKPFREPAELAKKPDPALVKIACLGDSITFGAGTPNPASDSYPAQLQRMLGTGYLCKSFGKSGTTVCGGSATPYSQTSEFAEALKFEPDVVIWTVGTNDAHPLNWPKAYDRFYNETRAVLRRIRAIPSQPKIILGLPPSVYGNELGGRGIALEQDVWPLLRQIAREEGLDLIDFADATSGVPKTFPDNLHPNLEGAALMAFEAYLAVRSSADTKVGWKVVSFTSEEAGEGRAEAAIDGDPETYWHTRWSKDETKNPHELVVDFGAGKRLSGLRLLPRQDGGINGRIAKCEIFLSADGKHWGEPAFSGTLPNSPNWTRVRFSEAKEARFLKLVVLSEANGGPWASLAELDIIPAP